MTAPSWTVTDALAYSFHGALRTFVNMTPFTLWTVEHFTPLRTMIALVRRMLAYRDI